MSNDMPPPIKIRDLGLQDYQYCSDTMRSYSQTRDANSADEIWILEHPPVFTLGLNGKPEHILTPGDIPVIHTDRGGQVTYHGPGQVVIYTLLDLKRLNMNVRQLVSMLEQAIIDTLAQYGIRSAANPAAPGVYVEQKKIAAVGLRITKGCSYHGLSINNCMDLTPFTYINPCGFANLEVTQLSNLGVSIKNQELAMPIVHALVTTIKQTQTEKPTA